MTHHLLAQTSGANEIQQATGDIMVTLFGGLVLIILVGWFFATERERVKRNIGLVLMLSTVFFSLIAISSPQGWIKSLTGEKSFSEVSNLRRGIDIAGGVSFTMQVKQVHDDVPVTVESLSEVKVVLAKRLESKFPEVSIVIQPEHKRIEVQIPDVTDIEAEEIREKLEQVASLDFYKVDLELEYLINSQQYRNENGEWLIEKFKEENILDQKIFPIYSEEEGKESVVQRYVVTTSKIPFLRGEDVESAYPNQQTGTEIVINLTGEGGDKNKEFTSTEMRPGVDRIAIIFDNACISSPRQSPNATSLGSSFVIDGMEDIHECKKLASSLANPLKTKPEIIHESKVSATLGEATVRQGIKAGIFGLGITLILVLVYYRLAGLIALIGLSVNILLVFGSMALMNATFTLPGIAGVILTIGVAIDANVLIYERLREERELGKSFMEALRTAYEKAFSAIIDANITTLITAVILFAMATGSVKGFAVTLTIGIMGTLLASLVFTRALFWLGADFGFVKDAKFLNLIPKKAFNFMSKGKLTLTFSSLLIVAALVFSFVKGKEALGVDFTGGTSLSYQIKQEVFSENPDFTQASIQKKLEGLDISQAATAQIADPTASEAKTVTIKLSDNKEDQAKVDEAFRSLLPILTEKTNGSNTVSGSSTAISAAMGKEFLNNSLIALGVGLVCIMIYITLRFEFSFAVGAFCALVHDVIIVFGVLLISGQELSMIHVGAFLTIAGYSINDTIVVFDRVRENLKYSESSISSVMNSAISSTLSRTILTSVTTFVSVFILFIFGGSALSDFSFTIMVGVVVGTYSSIFVASPIVWLFSKARGNDLREEVITAQKAGEDAEEEIEFDVETPAP